MYLNNGNKCCELWTGAPFRGTVRSAVHTPSGPPHILHAWYFARGGWIGRIHRGIPVQPQVGPHGQDCLNVSIIFVTWSKTLWRSAIRVCTLVHACMTVVWSRPPNTLAIEG